MTLLVQELLDRIEALPEAKQDMVVKTFLAQLEIASDSKQNMVVADLKVDGGEPLWKTSSPEKLAQIWTKWVDSHKGGPGIPDEALRRTNMYD